MPRKVLHCTHPVRIDPELAARSFTRAYSAAVQRVLDSDAVQRTLDACRNAGMSDEDTARVCVQSMTQRARAVVVRPSAKLNKNQPARDAYTRHLDSVKKSQVVACALAHERHALVQSLESAEVAHAHTSGKERKQARQAKRALAHKLSQR